MKMHRSAVAGKFFNYRSGLTVLNTRADILLMIFIVQCNDALSTGGVIQRHHDYN